MLIANVWPDNVIELYRDAKEGSLKPTGIGVNIGTSTDM